MAYSAREITWAPFRSLDATEVAHEIVNWINTNGGEARYVDRCAPHGRRLCNDDCCYQYGPRIVIRGLHGGIDVIPGDTIVMGEVFTVCEHGFSPATCRNFKQLREFTVRSAS